MKVLKLSIILIFIVFLNGCTHMQIQPLHTIDDYQVSSKYELKTELNLTEELKNSKSEYSAIGDTWIIPLGENLTHNSEVLVRSIFSDVYLSTNDIAKQNVKADIIITPRLVSVDQSFGVWKWSESFITLSLEWSLNDASGNPLWIDTVKGTGKSETGNAFTFNDRTKERVKMALEDLYKKSYHAFSTSKIIRDIENKKKEVAGK